MPILQDFYRALTQLGDPRFRRVLGLGVALSLGLLVAIYAVLVGILHLLLPAGQIELPWIGSIGNLPTLATWASAFLMLGLSVFLMVPVASAFTGLFLEDVADAVEAKHYPNLPPPHSISLAQGLVETASFFGLVIVVNLGALLLYPFVGPLAPFLFWGVNGFLLGREYFTLAAMRRMDRAQAKKLWARSSLQIWIAGMLMAVPLSIPVINLLVPVLGAATFTHIFHRLNRGQNTQR